MTDKELLELAAKAAEMPKGSVMGSGDYLYEKDGRAIYWNPLKDDGDAFRLAVKLMEFEPYKSRGCAPFFSEDLAATRRAIVRAAAEIGKI